MDWREFMRGFFGYTAPTPSPPPQQHRERDPNHWPPPVPIPEFSNETEVFIPPPRAPEIDQPLFPRGGFFWGHRPMGDLPQPGQQPESEFSERGREGYNQFVFGDLMGMMGEMFKEAERSMRDMERFFGNVTIEDNGRIFSHLFPHQDPNQLPPETPQVDASTSTSPPETTSPKQEENLRDSVLKENDTLSQDKPGSSRKRHYLDEPKNPADKVDRDLDVLYEKSMLDLSELPLPSSQEESQQSSQRGIITPYRGGGGGGGGVPFSRSYSQRTYQTFSFKNGRMEGETVKEDERGRHVTKYYVDENGKKHETTEFHPRGGGSRHGQEIGPPTTILPSNEPTHFAEFFDKIFKPRM